MIPETSKPKRKSDWGGARIGAGRPPKLGTVQWKVRTTVEVRDELRKRAAEKKVTPGDVVDELVEGLSDNKRTMLDGLFMEERRRLEEPESARSAIANQRRRQAAFVRELQRKLTGKGRD